MPAQDRQSRPSHAPGQVQSCHPYDLSGLWNVTRRKGPVSAELRFHSHSIDKCNLSSIRFDAFRSIFPAGTVSGAPKIKAIELVYELEQDRRGVYAGAVGRFDFAEDEMDVCIAIRTMVFKDGVAYLQAGGGIVFDSLEEDEYVETINKLKGNVRALEQAERKFSSPLQLNI